MNKLLDLAQAFALWVIWFLAPLRQIFATVLILVTVDVVSGVWASLKRGEKLKSERLRQSVKKTIGYLTALTLCLIVEPYLPDAIPSVKIMSGFIAMIEFQSGIENISVIIGVDLWAALRGKIGTKDKAQ